ncbi:response regulator [Rubrivirga sp.]|uniref:response regulator n=1 Tax=Rubrivirga sp. TaxID=1885344 RepID=UPI003B5301CC
MSTPPAVLLVEDDPTHQLIALSMLRHLGIEADAASSGAAGVQMASETDYDVVLLTVQMPVMDGAEAMRAIRARRPGGAPRVVAVTEHGVLGTRERMLEIGFDGVCTKPLSVGLLAEAVRPVGAPPSAPGEDDSLLSDVRAHVRSLLGEDDEDFVAELTETFVESAREALASVAVAEAAGDVAALAAAAHSLKGSASNVGLTALASYWDAVETDVRGGRVPSTDGLRAATEQTEETLDHFAALA